MKKTIVTKGKVLKFNHFSRKGFSLFACLGKVVLVGVLSVQTVQTANASGIGSGMLDGTVSDTVTANREYELEEVEVSSSLVSLSQAEEVRIVTVVQTADIQAVAPQSINDLLKLCAGIDVRQRAAIGAQTDVSIRGGFSEHIAILLDGINISDPQTAHNSLDLPVQLSEIERVEIIEGPAARFLGCGALLGGINIVTKKGNKCDEEVALSSKKRKLKGDIDVEGGSYGYINAGAYIGLSGTEEVKDLWNSLSGGYARSDGFSRSKNGNLN
ncbi:MAG: TonB-dependent receptor, partial [Bacteroidaceae bacterium]|nr:TonB-dependent receptor [Bacteroidaceae bacterium]